MKIVNFYQRETPHGQGEIFFVEDIVVVEMSQEEYQKCCHLLLAEKEKENESRR